MVRLVETLEPWILFSACCISADPRDWHKWFKGWMDYVGGPRFIVLNYLKEKKVYL